LIGASTSFAGTATASPVRKRPSEYDSGDDSDTSSNESAFLEDPFKAVKSHTSVVSASTSFAGTATASPVRKRPSEFDSGDDSDTFSNDSAFLEDPFKAVKSHTSVVSASTSFAGGGSRYLSGFKQYFLDEAKMFPDDPVAKSVPSREEVTTVAGTPQQNNKVDCGVFTCYFANYVSAEQKMDFSASDMQHLRRRLTLDILRKAVD